jgi:hypothetical protein
MGIAERSTVFCRKEFDRQRTGARRLGRSAWFASALALAPAGVFACACGCGVFDVGTSSMFPTQTGGMVYVEGDYMDQDRNWSGTASAPATANPDKDIRTWFTTFGGDYLFNRSWGLMVEVPWWERQFTTTLSDGSIGSFDHSAIGDVRLKAVYTGFSANLSSGLTLGVKLPTGDSSYPHFDPDVEIGSGSTDLLLGAYHLDSLTADNRWSWFVNAQWQQPVAHKSSYRPGGEVDAAAGIYYGGMILGNVRVTPIVQLELATRAHDGGPDGDPADTGYTRAYAAPGVEIDSGALRIYADVGVPVHTNASGNQLMAPVIFKLNVSLHF